MFHKLLLCFFPIHHLLCVSHNQAFLRMAEPKKDHPTVDEEKQSPEGHEPFAHPMATFVPNMGGEVLSHPDKKAPFDETMSISSLKDDADDESENITDTFVPFPPLKGVAEEPQPLTVRAVVVGIILGSLVNASNVYLGANPQPFL